MSGLILSAGDRAYFLTLMRRRLNSAVHRRMNVPLLLDDGWEPRRIAEALYIDEGTAAEHRRRYRAEGRAAIERLAYQGQAPRLSDNEQAQLSGYVDAQVPQTSKDVCAYVEAAFNTKYTPNAMTKLLKRLGFVHKKPKCIPAKADEAAQRRFVTGTLLPLMQASREDCPLYFVGAVHPAYTGRPAHGWIRKGQTRELKSSHGRTRLNINGALCWHDRAILHRQEEKITSAAMIALFEDIGARHPAAPAIPVVIDNAKYNVSREIRAWFASGGCRIRPVYLPSYAPNLNLIERFWRLLKRIVLSNKYYPKLADFRAAFDAFFENIGRWNHEIETLITANFHFIGSSKSGIP